MAVNCKDRVSIYNWTSEAASNSNFIYRDPRAQALVPDNMSVSLSDRPGVRGNARTGEHPLPEPRQDPGSAPHPENK